MFTLTLRNPKAPPNPVPLRLKSGRGSRQHALVPSDYKQKILDKILSQSTYAVGDTVKIRKGRHRKTEGILYEIRSNVENCEFENLLPLPLCVRIPLKDTNNCVYGYDIVFTTPKRCSFVGRN